MMVMMRDLVGQETVKLSAAPDDLTKSGGVDAVAVDGPTKHWVGKLLLPHQSTHWEGE